MHDIRIVGVFGLWELSIVLIKEQIQYAKLDIIEGAINELIRKIFKHTFDQPHIFIEVLSNDGSVLAKDRFQ